MHTKATDKHRPAAPAAAQTNRRQGCRRVMCDLWSCAKKEQQRSATDMVIIYFIISLWLAKKVHTHTTNKKHPPTTPPLLGHSNTRTTCVASTWPRNVVTCSPEHATRRRTCGGAFRNHKHDILPCGTAKPTYDTEDDMQHMHG